jgi:hypothetical protein
MSPSNRASPTKLSRRVAWTTGAILLAGCAVALTAAALAREPGQAKQAAAPTAKAPSAADLDRLLAPIALYPDQLLAQMLMCAQKPAKVATLNEWLASHTNEKGTALQDAATASGFEPPFVAMVLFPDVIAQMAERADWTTQLGQAFTADRSAVFGSIQRLRTQAQKAGSLKDTPQQDVETKTTSSGQQVIVIEPSNPQVVYVPQYNSQVVYTESSSSSSDAAVAGLIGFTAGIAIGAAIDNDYYHGPYGWGRGVYMYDDAWDDWYDEREDAREDWMDHREDLSENRSEVAGERSEQRTERQQNTQQGRTDRQQTRQENRPESQAQREQRRSDAQAAAGTASAQGTTRSTSTGDSRGYSGTRSTGERSGTKSDAFSGYSSGKSERAASQRGQRSRSSSRSSGGGGGSRRR